MGENEKNVFEKNSESLKKQDNDIDKNKTALENKNNILKRKYKIFSAKLPHNPNLKEFLTEKINLKDFTGFFNKKFNLEVYRKLKESTRLRLKSPKERIKLNHKRGNGIPNNIFERMKFLGKKFSDKKFLRYYNKKPKKKSYNFDEEIDYIVKYSKKNSELDSIMMAYYFVCKEIKFDKECYDNNEETKLNQSPREVFDEGLAVSSGFTNLFEYILKKMEIKFKHIDGYCKLMPKKNANKKLKKNKKIYRAQSAKIFNEVPEDLNEVVNHSWNAIYTRGEWYFCDCLFGSGSVEQDEDLITQINLKQLDINNNIYNYNSNMTNGNMSKNNENIDTFNFFYFMVPPEILISTHRPLDSVWQFLPKTLSFKEFYYKRMINYGEFHKNVYKYKVKLLSHLDPFISITTKEKLKIKIKIPNHVIEANLFYSLGNTKISEVKFVYDEPNDFYTLEPIFPQKGEYILKINARALKSTDLLYWPLLDYVIKIDSFFHINSSNNFYSKKKLKSKENVKVEDTFPKLNKNQIIKKVFTPKIVSDYSKIFPPKTFKKICYDNEDFKIMEPRSSILKKGATIRFKILVKGAVSVSILDGNHLTFLKKREGGIFVGQKELETNNVSLCCLRGKNVFTELYKFKVSSENRILSANLLKKRKKIISFK